jgi:hypothetical protein
MERQGGSAGAEVLIVSRGPLNQLQRRWISTVKARASGSTQAAQRCNIAPCGSMHRAQTCGLSRSSKDHIIGPCEVGPKGQRRRRNAQTRRIFSGAGGCHPESACRGLGGPRADSPLVAGCGGRAHSPGPGAAATPDQVVYRGAGYDPDLSQQPERSRPPQLFARRAYDHHSAGAWFGRVSGLRRSPDSRRKFRRSRSPDRGFDELRFRCRI